MIIYLTFVSLSVYVSGIHNIYNESYSVQPKLYGLYPDDGSDGDGVCVDVKIGRWLERRMGLMIAL